MAVRFVEWMVADHDGHCYALVSLGVAPDCIATGGGAWNS
jgi:hypothetical protein